MGKRARPRISEADGAGEVGLTMKLFAVFSLVLGVLGALFETFCWMEAMFALTVLPISGLVGGMDFTAITTYVFTTTWRQGLAAGVAFGLASAFWDLLRNRRDQSAATRLFANLFWCGCYGLILGLFNALLIVVILYFFPATITWLYGMTSWVNVAVPNLAAIVWATIRSVTTKDVLTPRVLRSKLRERARLE